MIHLLSGKNVLITGAGGWIGSALAREIAGSDLKKLVLLDHSERSLYHIDSELAGKGSRVFHKSILGDVCDARLIAEILQVDRPEIIYHAAAYKHVPLLENNPIAAIRNNAIGTNTLAEAAHRQGTASVVMISTDKAVEPSSILGASKRVAELAMLRWNNSKTRMRALRLGNVFGSEGSVVPLFLEQISKGGPLTVTHPEANRYFVTLEKAVELILLTTTLPGGGGIFVPELGPPVKIVDLAEQLIANAGSETQEEIPIIFTKLRPGEKTTEKIFAEGESLESAGDGRLFRVRTMEQEPGQFDSLLQELAKRVEQRDVAGALEMLRQFVPEYSPGESFLSLKEAPSAQR